MKILIPVDFSEGSINAVKYSTGMAGRFRSEIVLLHVVNLEFPPHASLFKMSDIEEAMIKNAKKDCIRLIQEIKESNEQLRVTYKIIRGYPLADIIENFSIVNRIDLIVLGTSRASAMKKRLMGSHAAAVVGKSSIPVITVPEGVRFKALRHIIYASDLGSLDKELKQVLTLAMPFNAFVHILYVVQPGFDIKVNRFEIVKSLIARFKYPRIKFHIEIQENLLSGIDNSISTFKGDLLVMFTHTTFIKKLFGKAMTRQMSFHCPIPLLSLKKTAGKLFKAVSKINHAF